MIRSVASIDGWIEGSIKGSMTRDGGCDERFGCKFDESVDQWFDGSPRERFRSKGAMEGLIQGSVKGSTNGQKVQWKV